MATGGLPGRPTSPEVAGSGPDRERDVQDISASLGDYYKSQLEGLSECLEQIMKEDAKKVHDDYKKKITEKLHGILPHDDDVNGWMLHPEKELATGFDTRSSTRQKRADFLRRNFHELNDLSVLIMNAPVNESCPTTDYLTRGETDQLCREFTEAKDTDEVLLVAPDNKPGPGKGDWFRTFAFTLSYKKLNKILDDKSDGMQRVEADDNVWDLSILYGEETRDEARPRVYRKYFKLSASAAADPMDLSASAPVDSMHLFDTVCTEIKKFYVDIDKSERGRQLEAEDYIKTVDAVRTAHEAGRVTIKSVTSPEEVGTLVDGFMVSKGVNSKTALVIFNGHGDQNGVLCLENEHMSQKTVLDRLDEQRDVAYGVPHSIDVVWGSCYSYMGIPTQQQDDRIQVIQRRMLPEGHPDGCPNEVYLEKVTLVDRPLRSYHLTCEDHKVTCSTIVFEMEARARGKIIAKIHEDLDMFGKKQNACGYNTEEARDVFVREQAADLAPVLEGLEIRDDED